MPRRAISKRAITTAEFQAAWADMDNQRLMWKIGRDYSHTLNDDDLKDCFTRALVYVLQSHDYEKQKFLTSLHRFTRHRCNTMLANRLEELAHDSLNHEACSVSAIYSEQEYDENPLSLGDSILYDWYVAKLRMRELAEKYEMTQKEVGRFLKYGSKRTRPEMELSLS